VCRGCKSNDSHDNTEQNPRSVQKQRLRYHQSDQGRFTAPDRFHHYSRMNSSRHIRSHGCSDGRMRAPAILVGTHSAAWGRTASSGTRRQRASGGRDSQCNRLPRVFHFLWTSLSSHCLGYRAHRVLASTHERYEQHVPIVSGQEAFILTWRVFRIWKDRQRNKASYPSSLALCPLVSLIPVNLNTLATALTPLFRLPSPPAPLPDVTFGRPILGSSGVLRGGHSPSAFQPSIRAEMRFCKLMGTDGVRAWRMILL